MKYKYRISLKNYDILKIIIKKIAEDYITIKLNIFAIEEIDLGILTLFDNKKLKDLLHKARIAIIYYGVLRKKKFYSSKLRI